MDFIPALFGIIIGMGLMSALLVLKRDLIYMMIMSKLNAEAIEDLKNEAKENAKAKSSGTDKTGKK